MPLQQFSTYDVIVDIVPGGFFFILLFGILPMEWTEFLVGNALIAGVSLLLGGYFAGRMIHGLSGFAVKANLDLNSPQLVELFDESVAIVLAPPLLMSRNLAEVFKPFSHQFIQRDKILSWGNNDSSATDNQIEKWFEGKKENVPDSVDWRVVNSVRRQLFKEMRSDPNGTYGPIPDSHPKAKRRYGENILYGENTLYHKYQMLVTFFRNTMMITLPFGLLYGIVSAGLFLGIHLDQEIGRDFTLLLPNGVYAITAISLISIFVIATSQRRKFLARMHRAFIYDLHRQLKD